MIDNFLRALPNLYDICLGGEAFIRNGRQGLQAELKRLQTALQAGIFTDQGLGYIDLQGDLRLSEDTPGRKHAGGRNEN